MEILVSCLAHCCHSRAISAEVELGGRQKVWYRMLAATATLRAITVFTQSRRQDLPRDRRESRAAQRPP